MSSPGSDSYESHTRKRVGKACDRCRLKKSKCDGASPCSRCKTDNAICVFGERKKAHDKVYPKGYVEMLEQQQSQLVAGLREMYTSLVKSGRWPGAPLKEHDGFPLTHDILERLGVLHMTGDNPVGPDNFEDNLDTLQARLMVENGASSARQRRSSPSTDSDPGLSHMGSPHSSPTLRHSSVSSTSSRKRASPETPPPSDRPTMMYPSKQQRYNTPTPAHQDELESQFWSQPIVVNSSTEFDFSSLAASENMYGHSIPPMMPNLSTMPINSMPPSIPMGIMTYDSDWDSFLRSGVDQSFS